MKTIRASTLLLACAAALVVGRPARAEPGPRIAVMPAQYFAADAQSAARLTDGIAARFEAQGYRVVGGKETAAAFRGMGLKSNRHYPDFVAVRFGRRTGADLVAYPRLLTLGGPPSISGADSHDPAAVVLLRVINVRTREAVYGFQIGQEFHAERPARGQFHMPQPVADATAAAVTEGYFDRIAGSRREHP